MNLCRICHLALEEHTNTQLEQCASLYRVTERIKRGDLTQKQKRKQFIDTLTTLRSKEQ